MPAAAESGVVAAFCCFSPLWGSRLCTLCVRVVIETLIETPNGG